MHDFTAESVGQSSRWGQSQSIQQARFFRRELASPTGVNESPVSLSQTASAYDEFISADDNNWFAATQSEILRDEVAVGQYIRHLTASAVTPPKICTDPENRSPTNPSLLRIDPATTLTKVIGHFCNELHLYMEQRNSTL